MPGSTDTIRTPEPSSCAASSVVAARLASSAVPQARLGSDLRSDCRSVRSPDDTDMVERLTTADGAAARSDGSSSVVSRKGPRWSTATCRSTPDASTRRAPYTAPALFTRRCTGPRSTIRSASAHLLEGRQVHRVADHRAGPVLQLGHEPVDVLAGPADGDGRGTGRRQAPDEVTSQPTGRTRHHGGTTVQVDHDPPPGRAGTRPGRSNTRRAASTAFDARVNPQIGAVCSSASTSGRRVVPPGPRAPAGRAGSGPARRGRRGRRARGGRSSVQRLSSIGSATLHGCPGAREEASCPGAAHPPRVDSVRRCSRSRRSPRRHGGQRGDGDADGRSSRTARWWTVVRLVTLSAGTSAPPSSAQPLTAVRRRRAATGGVTARDRSRRRWSGPVTVPSRTRTAPLPR